MNVLFAFRPVKKKIHLNSFKRNTYVEKGITAICVLQEDGTFKALYNKQLYNFTNKSLSLKNKDRYFIFSEKVPSNIIVYYTREFQFIRDEFPLMPLAPGYYVHGDIIEDTNNEKLFEIRTISTEIDTDVRAHFRLNAKKLIDAYNEFNRPTTTEEE